MNAARAGLGVGVLGEIVYALGGYNLGADGGAPTFLSSVEVYAAGAWTVLASGLPSFFPGRALLAVAVLDSALFVLGGIDEQFDDLTATARFVQTSATTGAGTWTQATTLPLPVASLGARRWATLCTSWAAKARRTGSTTPCTSAWARRAGHNRHHRRTRRSRRARRRRRTRCRARRRRARRLRSRRRRRSKFLLDVLVGRTSPRHQAMKQG